MYTLINLNKDILDIINNYLDDDILKFRLSNKLLFYNSAKKFEEILPIYTFCCISYSQPLWGKENKILINENIIHHNYDLKFIYNIYINELDIKNKNLHDFYKKYKINKYSLENNIYELVIIKWKKNKAYRNMQSIILLSEWDNKKFSNLYLLTFPKIKNDKFVIKIYQNEYMIIPNA
jgi:hypothetical protein